MARRAPSTAPAPPAPAAAGGSGTGAPPAPAAPAPGTSADASSGGRSSSRFNQSGFGPTAGGVVLGAFAVVLFVQYSRGGSAQVKAWFAAKFLNNASTSAGAAGSLVGQGVQIWGQGVTLGATGAGGTSGADSGGSAPSSPPTNKQGLQ